MAAIVPVLQHKVCRRTHTHAPIRLDKAPRRDLACCYSEVVAPLRVDGARARARAEYRADGRALAAAGDRADDRADRRADGRALLGRLRLVLVAHRALVINLHGLAIRGPHAVEEAREL